MKTLIIHVYAIALCVSAFALGWTSRGDAIYGKIFETQAEALAALPMTKKQ